MRFLPSIILACIAFGMGLLAAATYPGPYSVVYSITSGVLGFVALIVAVAIGEGSI